MDLLKMNEISTEILELSHNTILVNLRFMDAALAELTPVLTPSCDGLATNGTELMYNPLKILKRYAKEQYVINRYYLHLLLHCLYRHNFSNELLNESIWDLACDIVVENIINELDIASFESERASKQTKIITDLKNEMTLLTAEKIYGYYLNQGLSDEKAADIRKIFFGDDHSGWYRKGESAGGESSENDNSDGHNQNSGGQPAEQDDSQNTASNENSDGQSRGGETLREERWKEIAERAQQEIESFSKQRGYGAGSLLQNLEAVNRERYDYTAFLKKFAVMGETMKINDDEFDYIFYTYGLKLYKNMPLIEPLEYKDVKRIREFAIVIDTSGSVSGELVQIFINKTYNILKSTESFFSKINLYIIQCDARVQDVAKITSQDEFDEYIKTMKLHGFGGTDFRPAFEHINELVRTGEFVRLKGVIYFTDGYGVFPPKKPQYDSAFVFIRDDYSVPEVPPWAIRLILELEDIKE